MARKKVRFIASVDKAEREIFSVGEGANGDLSVFRRAEDRLLPFRDDMPSGRLLEDRFSVHRSERSLRNGTTITRTVALEEGPPSKYSAFVKNSKNNLLWHLFSTLSPKISNKRYDPSGGATKIKIILADDVPTNSTLCYHVFVANPRREVTYIPWCTLHVVEFKFFKLLVYVNFVNLPSSNLGNTMYMPTTPGVIDGKQNERSLKKFQEMYPDGAINLVDNQLPVIINTFNQRMFFTVMATHLDRLEEEGNNNELIKTLANHQPHFSIYPASISRPLFPLDPLPDNWTPPKQE